MFFPSSLRGVDMILELGGGGGGGAELEVGRKICVRLRARKFLTTPTSM